VEQRELKIGDIVQIDPEHDDCFGGCLMIVTEPKSFGAMGRFSIPERGGAGQAYYRCAFEHMELVGHAEWLLADEVESPEPV
jgi:hypothetical protein